MAERTNPYGLKVDLEDSQVVVTVREKDAKGNFTDLDSKAFDISGVHASILDKVSLYGLSKLLQDRSSDTKAGPDKLAAMDEVYSSLAEGNWERERKAGAPTVSAEVMALAELKGVPVADIQKSLRNYPKDVREKILSNPKVVERAAEIRERSEEVSLDDMA